MIQPMPALARFALGEAKSEKLTLEGRRAIAATELFGSP